MGQYFFNKITVLGKNREIARFINNEKQSEYLRKYKKLLKVDDFCGTQIEYEVDDYTQPIEDYNIRNNEFIHYNQTYKDYPVDWLLEMSSKYRKLYFKICSHEDGHGRDYLEIKDGKVLWQLEVSSGYLE